MKKIISLVAMLLFAAALASPALAAKKNDKPGWEDWDRLNIDVGVFSATQSTTLRLDALDATIGSHLDFEDNLGLEDREETPRFDLLWRYKKRSSLSVSYFKLERDTVAPLTITIKFGDIILEPTTTSDVRTVYDIEVISAQWGYSFFRTPKWDARFTIGIYAMDIFASLQDPAAAQQDEGDVLAPLPVLSLGFVHKLQGRWPSEDTRSSFISPPTIIPVAWSTPYSARYITPSRMSASGSITTSWTWMPTARIKIGPVVRFGRQDRCVKESLAEGAAARPVSP